MRFLRCRPSPSVRSALRDLGASAQQIVGKLNTICLASISVAFLGEHLPSVVVLGSGLVARLHANRTLRACRAPAEEP
ncbi:hypothetical protein AK812_SmicGene25582 [Symbiodinium microadriaticum]|uniref:Uncharacterized protein n=1 Tax=Symbiodinium microadriaticum TaxID=2951 RepID=A0A1Q9DBT4_SYMMI|nr:hypothetical protein AK812_SmicGene25582 [Symbiodinium microadriaticum]